MWKQNNPWVFWGVAVLPLCLLLGCAVGPNFVRPQPPAVDRYTQGREADKSVAADNQAQYFQHGAKSPGIGGDCSNPPNSTC